MKRDDIVGRHWNLFISFSQVANDVRKQATSLLEEIKSLSRQNEELVMEKEKDAAKIKELTAQASDWKSKYEKVKIDLRNLKGKD